MKHGHMCFLGMTYWVGKGRVFIKNREEEVYPNLRICDVGMEILAGKCSANKNKREIIVNVWRKWMNARHFFVL